MVSRVILTCCFWAVSGAFVSRLKPNDPDMAHQGVRDNLLKSVYSKTQEREDARLGPPRSQPTKTQATFNPFKPTGRPGPKAKSRPSPKSPSPKPQPKLSQKPSGNPKVVHVNPFAAAAKRAQANAADFLKATPTKIPSKTASLSVSSSPKGPAPSSPQEAASFLNERTTQLLKSMTREISKLQMWAKYFDKVSVASLKRNDETIAEEIQMLQSKMMHQEMVNQELREDISSSMNWLLSVLEATGLTERSDHGTDSNTEVPAPGPASTIDFDIA